MDITFIQGHETTKVRHQTMMEAEKTTLLNEDEESSIPTRDGTAHNSYLDRLSSKPKYTLHAVMLAALISSLLASTIWVVIWTTVTCPAPRTEESTNPPAPEILHCGNSPEEARSRNCKLQTWSYSWVPEPCFDAELNAEFIDIHKAENLRYYTDINATNEVDFATVYRGELRDLYTGWGSHYWHCAFFMRKFFRGKAVFTDASREYSHVEHCQKWVAEPFRYDWHRITTKAVLVYATCSVHVDGQVGFQEFENFDIVA